MLQPKHRVSQARRACHGAAALALAALALGAAGQLARWFPVLDIFNFASPLGLLLALDSLVVLALGRKRRGAIFVTALALCAVAFSTERIIPEYWRAAAPAASAASRNVVILTANVWRNNSAPADAARTIAASGADVVVLQEASGIFNVSHAQLAKAFPYETKCRVTKCELVIFSRWPLDPVRYRYRARDGAQIGPSLIHTRVRPPGSPSFAIVTLHFPRINGFGGVPADIPVELAQTVPSFMESHMIIAGDLNLTPWTFALQQLDQGLAPMTRITGKSPSYPGNLDIFGVTVPAVMPIDHIYVGPSWLVRSVETLRIPGADHRAVRAVLQPI
ncbi:MAG: endonuclease/exonuclease/phosphatase family protein [Sphingobium sp.]